MFSAIDLWTKEAGLRLPEWKRMWSVHFRESRRVLVKEWRLFLLVNTALYTISKVSRYLGIGHFPPFVLCFGELGLRWAKAKLWKWVRRVMALLVHFVLWPIEPEITPKYSALKYSFIELLSKMACFVFCAQLIVLFIPNSPPHPVSTLPPPQIWNLHPQPSAKHFTTCSPSQNSSLPPVHSLFLFLPLFACVWVYAFLIWLSDASR